MTLDPSLPPATSDGVAIAAGTPADPGRGHAPALADALCMLLAADPAVLVHGPDGMVTAMLPALGLAGRGVAVVRARTQARDVTLVAVPYLLWPYPWVEEQRVPLLELKRLAGCSGRRVVLLPEARVRREPRATNARLVAQAAGTDVPPRDRLTILGALVDEPGIALGDLAALASGAGDPVAAVLALVAAGLLHLDLDHAPVGPATQVWPPPRREYRPSCSLR